MGNNNEETRDAVDHSASRAAARPMKILVLGAATAGGFPQWNCNCAMCAGQRSGRVHASARTQSSIAISSDGHDWVLVNASPDIAEQIRTRPVLQPRHGLVDTPIGAVVLTDAQIEHVGGLLSLREGNPIELYATPSVFEDLTNPLPLLPALQHYCGVHWHIVPIAGETYATAFSVGGFDSLAFEAMAVAGAAPPYASYRGDGIAGDNIALRVQDLKNGSRLFYAPNLPFLGKEEIEAMSDADCVLIDGTRWGGSEMLASGLMSRQDSVLNALGDIGAGRKLLIRIPSSDPVLDERSAQRATLDRLGIEVAYDGMEIQL
jgi:pyrroloquinoline quinone biosynthesis protein B